MTKIEATMATDQLASVKRFAVVALLDFLRSHNGDSLYLNGFGLAVFMVP